MSDTLMPTPVQWEGKAGERVRDDAGGQVGVEETQRTLQLLNRLKLHHLLLFNGVLLCLGCAHDNQVRKLGEIKNPIFTASI
jgi:hypothetical protein